MIKQFIYFFFNDYFFYFLLNYFIIINILISNILSSLFWLILLYFFNSLILIFFGFEFLGFMAIIIYIGAISILFIFILMMFETSFKIINLIQLKDIFYFWCLNNIILILGLIIFNSNFLILKDFLFIHYNLLNLSLILFSLKGYGIIVLIIGFILLFILCGLIFLTSFTLFKLYKIKFNSLELFEYTFHESVMYLQKTYKYIYLKLPKIIQKFLS